MVYFHATSSMLKARNWAKSPVAQKVSVNAVRMKIMLWLFVEVGGRFIDERD